MYKQWSEARTRVEPGEYHIKCIGYNRPNAIWMEGSKGWGKVTNRLVVWFEIIEGPSKGKIIPMFFNLSENQKVPEGSRYNDAWRIANGGQRPPRARFKEMNPSKFLNKSFRAEIVDIKPKWRIPGIEEPQEKPEIFFYSKVFCLYELLTGDPKN